MNGKRESGYVIIEGNIGVGKSTFSALLAEALQAEGCRAEYLPEPDETNNPFLTEYYAHPKETAYKMQLHLLHTRFASTQYAQTAAMDNRGWYILDRSYYGDICFAKVQVHDGFFTDAEYASYMRAHRNMRRFIEPPTLAIFLNATPETCARRIAKRARECESGVPLDYLRALDAEISQLATTLKGRCPVVCLDWNDPQDLDGLKARAKELAHYLTTEVGRDDWEF